MHNPHIFTSFMAWKGLFQHLEKPPMDDYFEFKHAHKIQIEEWQLYQLPNYVSITRGIVAPSGTMTIPNTSLIKPPEVKMLMVVELLKMVGPLKVVVPKLPLIHEIFYLLLTYTSMHA